MRLRRHPISLLILCVSVASVLAQTPQPPASSAPVPVIHASTQLVVVDVVVTDGSHKPVHGLKASDFGVTENGAQQSLRSFEEHSTSSAPSQPEAPPPPGIYTNQPAVKPGGAVNILLLDTLNTPINDQSYLHSELMSYLKSAQPGARIAIFGLSDHLTLLQGFSDDPAKLRDAFAKINPKASSVRSDVMGNGIQQSAADFFEDSNDPLFAEVVANLRQWDSQQKSLELQERAKLTMDALNQLAGSLSTIAGRKNLIWFSASFPLDVPPDTTDNQGSSSSTPANDNFLSAFASQADVSEEFHKTLGRLSSSQIAVYPVDVRGVTQAAMFDAGTSRNYTGARGAQRFSQDQSQFVSDTAAENGTMLSLAKATGGHAFIGTNDLAHAVKESIDDGSNFYSLSYSPTDSRQDGKLRKIRVQLAHSGYSLSYRQSYYANPPDAIKTNGVLSTKSASATNDPAVASIRKNLQLAMMRGAPLPTDILFKAGVVPVTSSDKTEPAPAPNNTATPKAHGPWRWYSVNYLIDPAGLVFFRQPDGKVRTDFDLIVFAYTPDGGLVDSFHQPLSYSGSDSDVRDLFQHGMTRHAEVSVPAAGQYFLRIAVHDLHRDHYGAIEVPTSEVNHVVPSDIAAQAPPPPSASN